ncbi:uncharacterized protein LOC119553548 [Drosophila subpulchrella]|uniref:uncharacterized protein LOC119553548 n=1 Tax=Drosophila subpulchrella TaxID=1486046 RepID=UPI0018A195E1|nr:uncharacterized protein LOC119553548 [Drosophila subpulchrella]
MDRLPLLLSSDISFTDNSSSGDQEQGSQEGTASASDSIDNPWAWQDEEIEMQAAVPASTTNGELAETSEEETSSGELTDSLDEGSVGFSEDPKQWVKRLIPKDAIAVVNEIKEMFVNNKTIKRSNDGKITALLTINSKQFEGQGSSKYAAQSAACEKALRDFFCAKLNTQTCQQEIPVLKLASFAIHKLYEEWQIDYKAKVSAPQRARIAIPRMPLVRSQLPDDWKKIHPTSLLKYMRPFAIFNYLGCTGVFPYLLFNMGTKVDNQEFKANGNSKKKARRNLAVLVCNTLFGTDFIAIR